MPAALPVGGRRCLLAGMKPLAASVGLLWATCLFAATAAADWQPLWPGDAPGGRRPAAAGEAPQYEAYLPEAGKRSGAAVAIFPGGGYSGLAMGHEGVEYAKWLNARGIVGVVVKYRVSGNDAAGFQFPVPLLDARRAIRVIRSLAKEWGVDPAKVGVMGVMILAWKSSKL